MNLLTKLFILFFICVMATSCSPHHRHKRKVEKTKTGKYFYVDDDFIYWYSLTDTSSTRLPAGGTWSRAADKVSKTELEELEQEVEETTFDEVSVDDSGDVSSDSDSGDTGDSGDSGGDGGGDGGCNEQLPLEKV